MQHKDVTGHLLLVFTVLIWGSTFISTKVLLAAFTPVEILFTRFIIALPALWLVYPRPLRGTTLRQESTMAAAGLCGICLYYLLENIALTHTTASNVGVIISTSPFFTALLSRLLMRGEERLSINFFAGFVLAITGISLMSFHGGEPRLNLTGDLLALLAAFVWACYSLLVKKISTYGHHSIASTRRIFAYGILFMLPVIGTAGFSPSAEQLLRPLCLANLLYLGIGASAACFATWSIAVKLLGTVRASIYIYLIPVITVWGAVIFLREQITPAAGLGMALTVAGVILSGKRPRTRSTAPAA